MLADEDAPTRDIAVVGGSAGSLEALRDIVGQLPADSAIAMFVVVHILPTSPSRLPQILARAGRLPVRHAREGDRIEPGRILVAPPDRHLLLDPGGVQIDDGPRVNSTRPALDPLFRSAAAAFGPRVCGAVLSGNLDDGSEGLRVLASRGGLSLVQDPQEAPHPEMPLNALRRVPAAEVLSASAIGRRLATLAAVRADAGPAPPDAASVPLDLSLGSGGPEGVATGLTCPDCGGVLWTDPDSDNLRCRAGHAYGLETLWAMKSASVEQAVWTAMRTLQEDAGLAEHLAARARASGSTHTAARFERRYRDATRHAEVLRRLVHEREPQD